MATRAARTETTYEVYLLEGRHWQLHARFRSNEKDSAIAEARDMDRRGEGHGVKVVREIFYPDYNKTEEAVIFVGKHGAQQSGGGDLFDEGRGGGQASGPAPSGLYIAWRIIVITIVSLGFGILVALGTSMLMAYLGHIGINTGSQAKGVVVIAFLLGVVVIALPMLISLFVALSRASAPPRAAAPPKPKPRPKPKLPSEPEPDDHGFEFDSKMKEDHTPSYAFATQEDYDDGVEKTPWWKLSWFSKKDRGDEDDEDEFSHPAYQPSAPAEPPVAGEEAAFSIAPDEEEEEEPVPEADDVDAQDFEAHRLSVMRFLGGAIAAIKTVRPQLDAYAKFAVDLTLAGACEVVAARAALSDRDKRVILKEAVEMIGTKPDLAQAFADKYESYFVESRYKQMAEIGRESMNRFLAGEEQPFMALPAALESWDKPQMKPGAQQSIMTIFFTDMVGSTDMTQEKGDFAAQEIVRRHNAIVRSALAEYGGQEIKHTGDGIMASCPTAPSALLACIAIQRGIASFNATNPPIPLEVRIGLNSGEPIVEENDLFGATVQLAARVCAQAKARQILCSQTVFDLAASKAELLTSLGQVMLKGFKEPVPVYEVRWEAGPQPTAAPAAPSMPLAQSQPQ